MSPLRVGQTIQETIVEAIIAVLGVLDIMVLIVEVEVEFAEVSGEVTGDRLKPGKRMEF